VVTASRPQPGPTDTRHAPRGRRIGQRVIAPLSGIGLARMVWLENNQGIPAV
jgi:hypothetical protein